MKINHIQIGKRKIGPGFPCFIVAEISANHHQKYEEAVKLIKVAAKSGVDAVKLQTYTPDTMTINLKTSPFVIKGKNVPSIWKNKSLYELYQEAYTPWEWQPKLKKLAEDLGLVFFSTPFDKTAVDFLESINVPCYKIASYEALDVSLLRKVAKTGKPVIISEGFYPLKDVKFSIETLKNAGAGQIAVLHCVTQYTPSPNLESINLKTISDIKERFKVVSGFSDNNAGIEIPTMAAYAGASIIEKHFILSRKLGGPDAHFSIEPDEMKKMVENIRRFEKAVGEAHYGPSDKETAEVKKFCRSLFVVKDVKKGEKLTTINIRSIRPAAGLSPKFWDQIIGKKAACDIKAGIPLSWRLIKNNI